MSGDIPFFKQVMQLQLSDITLSTLLQNTYKKAWRECMQSYGKQPKYISQNTAYKIYNRCRVKRWVKMGKILPVQGGIAGKTSTIFYEHSKLEVLDTAENIEIFKL